MPEAWRRKRGATLGDDGLKVLAVASECFPVVKTGGLADVVGALPGALAEHGIFVRTLVPGYPGVMAAIGVGDAVATLDLNGAMVRVRSASLDGLDLLVLDAPHLFDRPGTPYNAPDGQDWPDNPLRFAALCQAGAAIARGAVPGWQPDLVHAHDWQAGLLPALLHYGLQPAPPSVFTVHNLAFHGWAPAHLLAGMGLPAESFTIEGVEFHGGIGALKAGLRLADRITTVSPTYANEITRPADGQGLDGLLRTRGSELQGILNGIDTAVWNPAVDALLPFRYAGPRARARGRNKAALRAAFALGDSAGPLFGVVSRLTAQKGIDLVLGALPTLLHLGGQLALIGTGEPALVEGLRAAAAVHPGRVGVRIGYDEATAHLIQAGCDALLVPSRFEPCGLTQLCALRYGAIPVVSRVGGLADTVVDANPAALAAGVATGVQFLPVDAPGLAGALQRLATLYADPEAWLRLQSNAMKASVGWQAPAAEYAKLFASALATAARDDT